MCRGGGGNPLKEHCLELTFSIASKIIKNDEGKREFRHYRQKLEKVSNKGIDIIQDDSILTSAKIEYAENHNRDKHVIKYNSSKPAFEHLIMHELAHLEFNLDAQNEKVNKKFVTNSEQEKKFVGSLNSSKQALIKKGISEESVSNYFSSLFNGINSQIYNTPIDLFIENFLFNEFPALRPFQFVSLYNMLVEAITAVTDKKSVEITPSNILSISKIYNLVLAFQFKELYGVDFISRFNASKTEITQMQNFYSEYLEYKDDKKAGEEYELIQHWAEDLKIDSNFSLISEDKFLRDASDIDNFLEGIEKDPYGLTVDIEAKQKEMEAFQKSQSEIGTNMAVVMFMVEALQFFKNKTAEEIKNIAIEIALQGTQGFSPDKNGYRINSIKGKEFSGYQILAFYYVSFYFAFPEMLHQLQLPFDDEFQMANQINK